MKFITFLLIYPSLSFSWTLESSNGVHFNSGNIDIEIATGNCTNANLTPSSISDLVNEAIDDYWNSVPTSSINLKNIGLVSTNLSNPTSTSSASALASADKIIVGCSNSTTLFTSPYILAYGGYQCSNGVCRGAVLINDTATTSIPNISHQNLIGTFAHELGHTLGLGHSSVQEALMYYSFTGKTQARLHIDDIHGISYLYPNTKVASGLGGSCGTIDTTNKDKNRNNFFMLNAFLGTLIAFAINKFKRNYKYL